MDPCDLSDDQLDQLAQRLAGRLPTGTHGDNVILTRRQFALAASGVLSAGALMALGVDEASAQAAGQVGTSSDPVDAFAYDLDVQNGAGFNGTDISGVGSLSVNDVEITDNQIGSFEKVYSSNLKIDKESGSYIQYENGVSTSETVIWDGTGIGVQAAIIHVHGSDQSNGAVNFSDVINLSANAGPDLISENERTGAGVPADRTYTTPGNNDLALSMSSGTYDITANGVSALRNV